MDTINKNCRLLIKEFRGSVKRVGFTEGSGTDRGSILGHDCRWALCNRGLQLLQKGRRYFQVGQSSVGFLAQRFSRK